MKRINNVYEKIYSLENLELAEQKARAGKASQYGVQVFDKNSEGKLLLLQQQLITKTFKTSAYKNFTVLDPKERLIFCLPFYPDRILHHAIMNVLEDLFVKMFTADSFCCIKGRGIHGFHRAFKKALLDEPGTHYCLKIDVKKFYPSIDHRILKQQLQRKFKDYDLLWLLNGIIDSAPGVPIGNYLSQYFANFYLNGFDHWIKEVVGVKYYFRYCDDIRVLADSKETLHQLRMKIQEYFIDHLNITVKSNYQVFPVDHQGVDVVGYVYRHGYTRLRPSIKKRFARAMARRKRN